MNNLLRINRNYGKINFLNHIRNYRSEIGVYGYIHREKIQDKIPDSIIEKRNQNSSVFRWIDAFRTHGHRIANTNPVNFISRNIEIDELKPSHYGLNENDKINLKDILYYSTEQEENTVSELEIILNNIYCSNSVSAEFNYIENLYEREWVAQKYEQILNETVDNDIKKEIGELLIQSQAWDKFLATKFPTVKRYGGEGAESMLSFFHQIFSISTEHDIKNIILGMPHRGKLNLLVTMLNTRPAKIFRKLKGQPEFQNDAEAMCDIASHFHASTEILRNGKKVHLSMLHNPSHLECVNPVAMGKTLSKQQLNEKSINILLHGDAAFPGQGINQECLLMSGTPNFDIGGTIHMVVNNQVGFTTPGDRGRVTGYSTDLAKSINAPVFHVNADCPEMLYLISRLAFEYNQKFKKDVFIDYQCFRRWGHNELDDPTFTNPALYDIIHNRDSIPDFYTKRLIEEKLFTEFDVKLINDAFTDYLNKELTEWEKYVPEKSYFQGLWEGMTQATNSISIWNTGLEYGLLNYIGKCTVKYPENFNIHPHLLKTHIKNRLKKLDEGNSIDWATAESLAFGSLMYQGHNVRISGEDVGRGTFSHRHVMLIDQKTNSMYIPLNAMEGGNGGKLEVANSILSEEAVLGFEYGMAIDNPKNLYIWEAQFGDFFNGAQIIFDTFISSGETKWMRSNGLVVLLPHGYDGAASEHSSCRVERFLQMTDSKETKPDGDNVNFNVINPTTPAQYFHALRRQIIRNFRKPLIVVAPKTLLRLSDATSSFKDFQPGTAFQPILGDTTCDPNEVTKVILCSGKHYYNLKNERANRTMKNIAIIRLESLCPFPCNEIQAELDKFKKARDFVWSQEEPRNMGAWSFVKPRFENLLGRRLKYCGRKEAATPAVGVSTWHAKEVEEVTQCPFL